MIQVFIRTRIVYYIIFIFDTHFRKVTNVMHNEVNLSISLSGIKEFWVNNMWRKKDNKKKTKENTTEHFPA